jgi:hypothetical protein
VTLPLSEAEYRDAARRLLEHAGAGPVGRKLQDPVYQSVVEGRDPKIHGYSGCADAAHWLLYRLGVRSTHVNRDENHGWKPVVNVSELAYWQGVVRDAALDCLPKCGDIVIIWESKTTSDSHVMPVIEYDPATKVLLVCEAGQGAPCPIALHTHQLHQGTDFASGKPRQALFCGGRALQKWIQLMAALGYADSRGELVAPDLSVLDSPRDTDLSELAPESKP